MKFYQLVKHSHQIISREVDQYGQIATNGQFIVHAEYDSRAEALAHMDDFTVMNPHNGNRRPKNAMHPYWSSDVERIIEVVQEGSSGSIRAFMNKSYPLDEWDEKGIE